jgi:hypothetical protein
MKFLPATSPTSSTSGFLVVSASISKRVFTCPNLIQKHLRVSLLAMPSNLTPLESLTKSPLVCVEVSNVRFDENDGSRVEQSGVCDVGDEIPPIAIRSMDVVHIIPIEEHLLAEGEGESSTQVEPSPSHTQQAPQGPTDASQRQIQDPQPSEHDQDQDQVHGGDSSPMGDQDQAQDDEQAQDEGQGEDQNHGDDQVASQESLEEAQSRCAMKIESTLWKGSHTLESVIGSVRKGVSMIRLKHIYNF